MEKTMKKTNQTKKYYDYHVHTLKSDGALPLEEVIKLAIVQNPEARMEMAITDHNVIFDELYEMGEKYGEHIDLIAGCEVSTSYEFENGKLVEVHIVALNYDVNNEHFKELMKSNRSDKRAYVEKMLELLEKEGIHLFNSYEEVVEYAKPSPHIGRMNLVRRMVELGYVDTIDEGFNKYVGSYGERRCYVANPFRYISIPAAVEAIKAAGGVSVLAHPFFYNFDENELHKLIKLFKESGGDAMEVQYGSYIEEQKEYLHKLALQYELKESAGSDFHGNDSEHLAHKFEIEKFFD